MALLLKASGDVVLMIPANRRVFTLIELQTAVGGYIEMVRAPVDGEWLVVNEDGKRLALPINGKATRLLHLAGGWPDDVVVGDVILGTHAELNGDDDGDEASG